jgi:hypothetical protein
MATIVPVPKQAELSDYRPVALTSVIMKRFERLESPPHTTRLTHYNFHTAPTLAPSAGSTRAGHPDADGSK